MFYTAKSLPYDGILKNTKIRIATATENIIIATMLTGTRTIYIKRMSFSITLPCKHFNILRRQFPVRAGYLKTLNWSQEDTLQKCEVDLREEPFGHGQLYVSRSRVQSRENLFALVRDNQLNAKMPLY